MKKEKKLMVTEEENIGRLNYRKEFVKEGEAIKVILHEVPTGKVQDISDRLRTLKIRSEVLDPASGK